MSVDAEKGTKGNLVLYFYLCACEVEMCVRRNLINNKKNILEILLAHAISFNAYIRILYVIKISRSSKWSI